MEENEKASHEKAKAWAIEDIQKQLGIYYRDYVRVSADIAALNDPPKAMIKFRGNLKKKIVKTRWMIANQQSIFEEIEPPHVIYKS